MSQQLSPWLEGAYGWSFGEGGWNTGMDENLLKFSFMFDRNVDNIIASLPPAIDGKAYYLTTDNRLYFAVGSTYFSSPVPKWFTVVMRSTGQTHQFNGTSLVQIDTPVQLDTKIDAIELTISSLGTAAFEDVSFFASQADLDVAEAASAAYTDVLEVELANNSSTELGAAKIGYNGDTVRSSLISLEDFNTTLGDTATHIAQKLGAAVIPEQYGAVGDGMADDTAAVVAALASGSRVNGLHGKVYGVTGNITLPDNLRMSDIVFKQLSPNSTTRRTLTKTSGSGPLTLQRVKVDKNGATTDGSITDAAGIWIANINDVLLEDIEVTGNSKGTGIALHTGNRLKVVRPYVHDMRWSNATDPGTEQILGIWMQGCTDWDILAPTIKNLDGIIGANPARAYQTDGFSIGACSLFSITSGSIQNCGEGLDITGGGVGNGRFSIVGVRAVDIDSWGFKFANSAFEGEVIGCIARDCGFGSFVVSGAAAPGLPKCEDITFTSCKSINAGSNGNWSASATMGFGILQGSFDTDFPQGITFVNCEAIDEQGSPTMKYGFRSEPPIGTTTARPNRMINCHSEGHTISRKLGYIVEPESFGYASGRFYAGGSNISATTTLTLTANVMYAQPFEVVEEVLFTKIGLYVQTAVVGSARIGIYSAKDGAPDALMLDAGTVSTSTTGAKEITISKQLQRGKYFLAVVSDATATIYGAIGNVNHVDKFGVSAPGINDTQISKAFAFASLPVEFGAIIYSAANIPSLWMRL